MESDEASRKLNRGADAHEHHVFLTHLHILFMEMR